MPETNPRRIRRDAGTKMRRAINVSVNIEIPWCAAQPYQDCNISDHSARGSPTSPITEIILRQTAGARSAKSNIPVDLRHLASTLWRGNGS